MPIAAPAPIAALFTNSWGRTLPDRRRRDLCTRRLPDQSAPQYGHVAESTGISLPQ